MELYRQGLYRGGLFRHGLFRQGLILGSDLSAFDRLQRLDQPMVVAYEGDNPSVTGRYPQPTTMLRFLEGSSQSVNIGDANSSSFDHDKPNCVRFCIKTTHAGTAGIISKSDPGPTFKGFQWYLAAGSVAFRAYENGSSSGIRVTTNVTFNDGQWHVVEIDYDGSSVASGVTITVDGIVQAVTIAVDAGFTGSIVNSAPIKYGSSSYDSLYWTGNISGIEIEVNSSRINTPLNQTTGTIALDRNNNANPGTLVNGATWTVDNTLPWQADVTNEEGYTLGTGSNGAAAGVIIPPSTVDPTKDCLGNTLEWSGSVYPVIPVPEGSADVTFNGTTHHIAAAHLVGTETVVSSLGTSTPSVVAGQINFTAGTCAALLLSDGTYYPLTETSGTDVFNAASGADHGVLVNGATRTSTQDGYGTNLNQLNGFTLDGAVRIPALSDGSGLDARDGLPLTNPAVLPYGHNDAENTENAYEISETGTATAASVNLANFAVITFADSRTDLTNTAPSLAVYRRDVSDVSKDRLIAYYDTLNAEDSALAIDYTAPPTVHG